MTSASYRARRGELETYFDRTAAEAWKRLTSDAPVSGIRATVRAGRDDMRKTLLSWLPDDMHGMRLLDAGCGTGALAIEAARRGASVTAVDICPTLIGLARERAESRQGAGEIRFSVGDMLDPTLGRFDHVVAMDSLIHYCATDMVTAVEQLAARSRGAVLFTFAPRTALLAVMHAAGRFFPRGDRAPTIEPVSNDRLSAMLTAGGRILLGRGRRVARGFYVSQAMEVLPT
ncbi:magnesium protoporphyrin IX methyltransferase [Humitalea sp. 24SJ18S-53]|uniref:magnesium protoporphyrin IX methyltransferase n=1 Tax=Humitalea sp. 24SJ18S-53 TaxID=3422307 RepID=UPI003D67EFAB